MATSWRHCYYDVTSLRKHTQTVRQIE